MGSGLEQVTQIRLRDRIPMTGTLSFHLICVTHALLLRLRVRTRGAGGATSPGSG